VDLVMANGKRHRRCYRIQKTPGSEVKFVFSFFPFREIFVRFLDNNGIWFHSPLSNGRLIECLGSIGFLDCHAVTP
jgi:hypothetical protein